MLFTWLSPLQFLALSKIKKCPDGTKICWPFWHPMQCENVTVRYSGKWFTRLFPAVAPSSHEVHSFTNRVFQRRQQPLWQRLANFAFTGAFWELNCHTSYIMGPAFTKLTAFSTKSSSLAMHFFPFAWDAIRQLPRNLSNYKVYV
jgi:hypothetical protein